MKRLISLALVLVVSLGVTFCFAENADVAALQQLLQLLTENPGLVDQFSDLLGKGETVINEDAPPPIIVVDPVLSDNTIMIGKEVEIENLCAFTLTGVEVKDEFLGLSSSTHKLLVLDMVVQNLSFEEINLKDGMNATITYKGSYAFEGVVYPSLASFLIATWNADQSSVHYELKINSYRETELGKAQADILLTQKGKPRHEFVADIDEIRMLLNSNGKTENMPDRAFNYSIDLNENLLRCILDYSDASRVGLPLTLQMLESVQLHILFEVPNAIANDQTNMTARLSFLANEIVFPMPEVAH